MVRRLWLLISGSMILLGCQRQVEKTSSTITIQIPEKMSAMAAMPANRKACYGVNVTALDLPTSPANACAPPTSLRGGFVAAGSSIEMAVPKGLNRKVELFAYLQGIGQNLPCPLFGATLSATHLLNTYVVASATGVDMMNDVTVVELTADYPGDSNHIAQQFSLPASCTASVGGSGSPRFYVSVDQRVATGGGIKLLGGVGRPARGVASGGGIKLVTE